MKNLAKAVIAVMKEVKGMEKNSKVGSGSYAYDGTKDKDVKEVFNEKLAEHGLCILPTEIHEETQLTTWEEKGRQRQSVFTKVKTKYLLLHESGESLELAGYGHGVDAQDKGAGKATTYALKNCLLLSFLTPVGKIDDTDTTHSQEIPTKEVVKEDVKEDLTPSKEAKWNNARSALKHGRITIKEIEEVYTISSSFKALLTSDLDLIPEDGSK